MSTIHIADRTRPDIQASASILGSYATKPSKVHMKGCDHLDRYLHATADLGITYGGADKEVKLFGFSDASYIPYADSKSQLGYCFFLNTTSGAIIARSFKDSTVSHSSTEAEIKALDAAIKETLWTRGFLKEIGYEQFEPTTIYVDNEATMQSASVTPTVYLAMYPTL